MERVWRNAETAMKDVFRGVRLSDLACDDVLKSVVAGRAALFG